jgi:excisionase family DNA binding protein
MRKNAYSHSEHTEQNSQPPNGRSMTAGELPNRLMTAFEVAKFVVCHEETVRRAYLRGLLTSQRFGVRGRRFHPAAVLDWLKRGAPTRVSHTKGGVNGCSKDLQAERVSSEPTL